MPNVTPETILYLEKIISLDFILEKGIKHRCKIEHSVTQGYEVQIRIFFKHPGKSYTHDKGQRENDIKWIIDYVQKTKKKGIDQYERPKR